MALVIDHYVCAEPRKVLEKAGAPLTLSFFGGIVFGAVAGAMTGMGIAMLIIIAPLSAALPYMQVQGASQERLKAINRGLPYAVDLLALAKNKDQDALVMVITAYGSLESAEEAMAKGAFDFITKPFRKEQILLAIDKAMRWRELVRQNKEMKQRLEGG